ncbi:MAG: glycosyltransferase family 9 protein [SAR324 cluster bacterium]|nr:glycosyltransferase family 9 protein [SAR324 cluster bacterium]
MNLNFQRKLDYWAGTFLCRIFSFFSKKKNNISIDVKPKNILVILLSEKGALVLAHPMFKKIKQKYPDASIYVLLFASNREVLELLDVVPTKNIFTIKSSAFINFFLDSIHVLSKLRQIPIDTIIDCELFSRISSIYAFLSGAQTHVGFHPHTQEGLFRGEYINRPVPYNPYHHISQQFITLVEALESEQVPTVKRRIAKEQFIIPPLKITKEEIADSLYQLKADFPNITGKELVLINPSGGLLPIRAWPIEHYCHLLNSFIQNEYTVGIIGIEDDKKIADQVLLECKDHNCIDLTGYTKSIRELLIIFHFASLLITNDGGPGHFAGMTPIPSIIFFGPETPDLYGSLSPNAFSFYTPLSCSPCLTAYNHRNSMCNGNNLCLHYIQPEEVLDKAYEILNSPPSINFRTAASRTKQDQE